MRIEQRLFIISTLGVHSNFADRGFRQKDIRFLLELFTNWMDVFLKPDLPQWHNTQVMRYISDLEANQLARAEGKGRLKRYQLTRLGLLHLIQQLVEIHGYAEIRHVLLVFYFLKSYRDRMIRLIEKQGSGFSKSVQLELEHLLDARRFLNAQMAHLQTEIERLKVRVKETRDSVALAEKLHRQGEPVDTIIDELSRWHPYELEMQKPMAELLKEIEPEHRMWELTTGSEFRAGVLWEGQLLTLEQNLSVLKAISGK